ncbi:MAG: hypothetical protein RSC93_04335 [Erysipelotrichaceae bacterium]
MQKVLYMNKNNFNLTKLEKKLRNKLSKKDSRLTKQNENINETCKHAEFHLKTNEGRLSFEINEFVDAFMISTNEEKDSLTSSLYCNLFKSIENTIAGGIR